MHVQGQARGFLVVVPQLEIVIGFATRWLHAQLLLLLFLALLVFDESVLAAACPLDFVFAQLIHAA